jgi:RNA polymerase sigma-70 factor (ECF subfamily)
MDSGWVRKRTYVDTATASWGQVTPLPFVGADEELLEALHNGHPGAARAFYDRYSDVVDRILSRVIGPHEKLPDLIEEAFVRALAGVGGVQDPSRLPGFVAVAAARTARRHLRRRARGRVWAQLQRTRRHELDGAAARPTDAIARASQAVYDVLDELPVDERIALALRVIDAMPPAEIAETVDTSLGRLKRRLRRAEARFLTAARRNQVLRPWLDRGSRWSLPTPG